jgi:hypothetical protein
MPWVTLITGCLAGTVYLAVMARVADTAQWSLGQGAVRLAFLPAVAALAFVVRAPFRPVTQATPVPAWVAPVGHIVLSLPVLAVTCWAQLYIMTYTVTIRIIPLRPHGHPAALYPAAVYPLIAQLTGWCAVTVAAAACAGRSRYADLSGAIAAPVTLAAVALAWYAPVTSTVLVEPPASAQTATLAWYVVASAALALTCAAIRDQWHRYSRILQRLSTGARTIMGSLLFRPATAMRAHPPLQRQQRQHSRRRPRRRALSETTTDRKSTD